MRINVGCGEFPTPGWLNLDLTHHAADRTWDVTDGLPPEIDEPIDRIYAGHVFEHIEKDSVGPVLELWREHPMVTCHTLLAIVGPDCPRARAMHKEGKISEADLNLIVNGAGRWNGDEHLWETNGGEIYNIARAAGWGVAQPYDLKLLMLDGWPVASLVKLQFGALCRALK